MKRKLLILDGTHKIEGAFKDALGRCEADDKLTVLSVAEKPSPALLDMEPSSAPADPFSASTLAGAVEPQGVLSVPEFESEDATERRVAGELRDELDKKIDELGTNGVQVWTQAIVRDAPAEAVANYIRSSDITQVLVPASSLQRLQELLVMDDKPDALDGTLAPVQVLAGR